MKGYYIIRSFSLPVSVFCEGEAERSHVEQLSNAEFTQWWQNHTDHDERDGLLDGVDLVRVSSQTTECVGDI